VPRHLYLWRVKLRRPGHRDVAVGESKQNTEPKIGANFLLRREGGKHFDATIVGRAETSACDDGCSSFTVILKIHDDDGAGDWNNFRAL
jgi:hypothetical protein